MCCKKMLCCRKLERSHITDKWGTDRRLLMVSGEMSQVISFLLFLYLKLVVFKEKPKLELRNDCKQSTVFENHRKSRVQHCERSELRLHFE